MKTKIYQIDAFAEKLFQGNPAAVVPLGDWLPESVMQSIAAENNLSETVYFVPNENGFHIRWFTPTKEVALCGHATLAAAYVIFSILGYPKDKIIFESLSGELMASLENSLITLDFPVHTAKVCDPPASLIQGLGETPIKCFKGADYLVIFDKPEQIHAVKPNHTLLSKVDCRAIIITSPAVEYDFIARVFAPRYGIPEDPVTGSAYTLLAPYWSSQLKKEVLKARQVSTRGGNVQCKLVGDRVFISGKAVKFMEGDIELSTITDDSLATGCGD